MIVTLEIELRSLTENELLEDGYVVDEDTFDLGWPTVGEVDPTEYASCIADHISYGDNARELLAGSDIWVKQTGVRVLKSEWNDAIEL